ncbi:prepilin-type N-terminal cleavage/methylation domain-containing protein [bacterium]|nr:prepilin-type N-terminal cleavage/methylation domain-containing protein [Akkermansiaceae bacterium]MDB4288546.1 prepilin-type N-terminal cleavage/methylation domain-containing protein [bacterium]MDA8876148.1 prepilin-type N-terminal cleavage/methylation domain-containing protein [Akkermansiaceae bacterium]MDA8967586.1 prepilin-type N-terminal cleavage/methylation domain-containing protein [Akkermansiaceae bacterium]MDB4688317.1 prepilin-type N-terminal cleavage/methylation domain-containing 
MMILQKSQSRSPHRGFSLLEIIVVLAVAGVVLGAAALMISTPKAEQALREEHGKIEDLVRQGRALSVTYQQPFVIELRQSEARLRPFGDPGQSTRYEGEENEGSSLRPLDEMQWPRIEQISDEYEMAVRRWGQPSALVLQNDTPQIWTIEPQGLCEPISIRLSKDFGDISLARVYHPLTGVAEDEELTITSKK